MKKKAHHGKLLFVALILVGGAAAGFGYLNQTSTLRETSEATTESAMQKPLEPTHPLFAARENDIVIGNADAPITIVEYSSLSCPHCAHFHETVLPDLQKEYLQRGKAKLVFRHFPLNEPGLRGALLVECADAPKRLTFIKVLFDMQKDWAFSENFMEDLKRIAKVGGMDSASFESCMADKTLETRILQSRQEAATLAQVKSTPTFFINGVRLDGAGEIDQFRTMLDAPKP